MYKTSVVDKIYGFHTKAKLLSCNNYDNVFIFILVCGLVVKYPLAIATDACWDMYFCIEYGIYVSDPISPCQNMIFFL